MGIAEESTGRGSATDESQSTNPHVLRVSENLLNKASEQTRQELSNYDG